VTTHQLRPYQQQAVSEIRTAFTQRHRSVLFVLPTGGGKTTIFSHITEQTAARGNRVCVLVHRQELLRQASASLDQMGVPHGLVAANLSMDLIQTGSDRISADAGSSHPPLPAGVFPAAGGG
jgi:superfamily II DNA or RNA helicase